MALASSPIFHCIRICDSLSCNIIQRSVGSARCPSAPFDGPAASSFRLFVPRPHAVAWVQQPGPTPPPPFPPSCHSSLSALQSIAVPSRPLSISPLVDPAVRVAELVEEVGQGCALLQRFPVRSMGHPSISTIFSV